MSKEVELVKTELKITSSEYDERIKFYLERAKEANYRNPIFIVVRQIKEELNIKEKS